MDVNNLARLLEENANLFEALINLLPAPVYIKDSQGHFLQYNRAFAELWNLADEPDRLLGKSLVDLYDHEVIRDFHQREASLLQDRGCRIDLLDCSAVLDKPAVFHIHSCATQNENGELTGLVGIVFDITARAELERKLEQLSQVDELTGIANRRHGMTRLDTAVEHAIRHSFDLSLIMLDIDFFKAVNDQFGHRAGDHVLQELSKIMQDLTRRSDTLFRYGGEEFVVILPNTGAEGATSLAERFRESVATHGFENPQGEPMKLTISLGVASLPENATDTNSLFLATDAALYKAKSLGRNRTVHFSSIADDNA